MIIYNDGTGNIQKIIKNYRDLNDEEIMNIMKSFLGDNVFVINWFDKKWVCNEE